MKLIIAILLTQLTLNAFSQQADIPSNSFQDDYNKSNPNLKYSYDSMWQVHIYAENWDFDNDGIKDGLYFIGTEGAHLYYFLKVFLSTDKEARDFNFIQTDYPFLSTTDVKNIENVILGFAIIYLGKEMTPTIIVGLDDNTYYANKRKLSKLGIKTRNISISFENGVTKYDSL